MAVRSILYPAYKCQYSVVSESGYDLTFHFKFDDTRLHARLVMSSASKAGYWLSVGFPIITSQMIGTSAVIGDATDGVQVYDLSGKNVDLVNPLAPTWQTLTGSSFSVVGSTTTLTFSKLLSEDRPEQPSEQPPLFPNENQVDFLFAVGGGTALGSAACCSICSACSADAGSGSRKASRSFAESPLLCVSLVSVGEAAAERGCSAPPESCDAKPATSASSIVGDSDEFEFALDFAEALDCVDGEALIGPRMLSSRFGAESLRPVC